MWCCSVKSRLGLGLFEVNCTGVEVETSGER